ncbi:hypothetical protein [Rothia sp. P4278]|uniref:hypothetical protein n=1 Tax=Rothia sp. P4278 TaxID=3402658 RepID=UPI003ADD5966
MSSKAIEWARTHEFENGAVPRTSVLRFLAEQADDDGYIADHEGDKGLAFIMHETCVSKSTVIRILKEFEEADLLHRERRPYKKFGGRSTDLIVLHLYNIGTKTPWRTLKALKQLHKAGQAHFGAPIVSMGEDGQPVDNSLSTVGVTLTPSYETPNQPVGVTLTPDDTQGVTLTQARYHSDIFEDSALKGTRARTIPLTIPISQSVKETAPVDNSRTDGQTEAIKTDMPPAPITQGVNHQKLRQDLQQAGHELDPVSDEVLAQVIQIVFARSTQTVRSPQRFAFSCISKEFRELVSLAESVLQQLKPATAPQRITCPLHHTEHVQGNECPGCRADRLAGQTQPKGKP